jgi:hypothetical protein
MPKHIEIRFVDEKIAVRAALLEKEMPRTCRALLKRLPLEGTATHARYSGSELAMLIPKSIRIARERATCAVLPGDVAYVRLDRDDHYGLDDDVSEICWFYDRDAEPRMWEGPVRVNVFARIPTGRAAREFYRACADTRIHGVKRVRISLLNE